MHVCIYVHMDNHDVQYSSYFYQNTEYHDSDKNNQNTEYHDSGKNNQNTIMIVFPTVFVSLSFSTYLHVCICICIYI
jgi:hypothetical protein